MKLKLPPITSMLEEKTIDDLSIDTRVRMVIKIGLLGTLAWDYTETVLDIARQMKIKDMVKVSRAIQQVKREHDIFRRKSIKDDDSEFLGGLTDLFEQINQKAFTRLCGGLDVEIGKMADLNAEYVYLVKAVQMVMTVLDAMKLYDADCRAWIVSEGVKDHTFIPHHFDQLARLIPLYAGDCYDPKSASRKITARILYNEVKNIELYDGKGNKV